MSTDLILSIKNRLAEIGGEVDDDTRAVAGEGGSKRISIKGGVFRKIVGGKEVAAMEDRNMPVIFVRMAHNPSRTYYENSYQEGVVVSPSCWSNDSKTPDADVPNPQASACDKCPRSIKGSAKGGTGSACRIQWRTAVVLPNDVGGDVMQLTLPAMSCFGDGEGGKLPFRPYIQYLANNSISAGRVVTRMSFDTKSPVPRVLFSPMAAVEPEDMEIIKQQSQSIAAEKAITLTVYQADTEKQAKVEEEVAEVATPESPEPVRRETKKPAAADEGVPDIIAQWSKKG